MTNSLEGRVALVTGAGRGIGRAHALLLAERGTSVVVCDIGAALDGTGDDATVANAVVEEIEARGGQAVADATDISTFAGGDRAVQHALDSFGRIDIVVNNAGVAGSAPLETITEDELARIMAVNFVGSVGTVKAAWPHLKAQGWGRVVNTVSEVALDTKISDGGGVGYGAAKAAVWSFTLSMAGQGRRHGITVNAISPGAFTRMNEAMFAASAPSPELDLDPVHVAAGPRVAGVRRRRRCHRPYRARRRRSSPGIPHTSPSRHRVGRAPRRRRASTPGHRNVG